jgi:hypothetical protein
MASDDGKGEPGSRVVVRKCAGAFSGGDKSGEGASSGAAVEPGEVGSSAAIELSAG